MIIFIIGWFALEPRFFEGEEVPFFFFKFHPTFSRFGMKSFPWLLKLSSLFHISFKHFIKYIYECQFLRHFLKYIMECDVEKMDVQMSILKTLSQIY